MPWKLQVQKRMSHGLSGQVSYTWGRTIDSASGSTDGDQFQNGLSSLFFFDPRLRRGPSDFNQTHNVVFSYTWEIPSPKALPGVLGWAASGWEFGGIFEASTGVPFTVTIAPDPLGMNSTDAFSFPDIVRGCNPVHGGLNYVNLNCFTLPLATPDIAHVTVGSCALPLQAAQPGSRALVRTFWAMADATASWARDSSTWTCPCLRTTM